MNDFFAEIQELFGLIYIQSLSDDLYVNNIYISLCIFLFVFTFLWTAIFYFGLRSPKWGTVPKWTIWVLVGSAINFLVSFLISYNSIAEIYLSQNQEIPYSFNQFISISFSNFISSFLLSVLYSSIVKWKSINSSKIPF
jgi:hypothetical protein